MHFTKGIWTSAVIAGCIIVGVAATPRTKAETQQQHDWCAKGASSADLQISACTAVIQSGRYYGKDLAWAFSNRGIAYRAKKDYDRAIADLTKAIALNPKYTDVFFNRALTYQDKDDRERAIADYRSAAALGDSEAREILGKLGAPP